MQGRNLIQPIEIPEIFDDCQLYFAQNPDHIPFTIKRIYYITNSDIRLPRGFHAHKKTQQVIFCIQGSIKLILDNGKKRKEVLLSKPNTGVFVDKMIWHEMHNFKKETILLVIASETFDPKDYIRDYGKFKKKAAERIFRRTGHSNINPLSIDHY